MSYFERGPYFHPEAGIDDHDITTLAQTAALGGLAAIFERPRMNFMPVERVVGGAAPEAAPATEVFIAPHPAEAHVAQAAIMYAERAFDQI